MVTPEQHAAELDRIALLVRRDGCDAATAWVTRTMELYRQAVADRRSHASLPQYQPLFEDSIRAFEAWLRSNGVQAHQ
ncbi:MAG: hypothetical protein ACM3ZT_11490 [Bacillota bacterium]